MVVGIREQLASSVTSYRSTTSMKLHKGIVFSSIAECSAIERSLLDQYLVGEDGTRLVRSDIVYTGLLPFVQSIGVDIEVVNSIELSPSVVNIPMVVGDKTLRDYQHICVRKALNSKDHRGIILVATGGGKTLIATSIIMCLDTQTTVIVPSGFLMQQAVSYFKGCGIESVSGVGYGSKYKKAQVQVVISKSAANAVKKNTPLASHIKDSGLLLLDEGHKGPTDTWRSVCEHCEAEYRFALTATAFDHPNDDTRTLRDLILIGLTGPPIVSLHSKELRELGYLATPIVTMLPIHSGSVFSFDWHTVYSNGIVRNKVRNNVIATLVKSIYDGGYKVLVFVAFKEHGDKLARLLQDEGIDSAFVQGSATCHLYRASGGRFTQTWGMQDISKYVEDQDRCVLLTTSVGDEGVDLPQINALVMAVGNKKYRRYVQRVGRGMRPKTGDNNVYIFDFFDHQHVFLTAQSNYRLQTYVSEEFEFSSGLDETSLLMRTSLDVVK